MADQDRPKQHANKRNAARDEHPERNYLKDDTDNAGGITNRPLSDEVENQESLPERGTQKENAANPGSTRREGDYGEDER